MPAECIECDRYPCRCDDRLADDDEPEPSDYDPEFDEFNPHECPDCGGELDADGCPECGWYDNEEEDEL